MSIHCFTVMANVMCPITIPSIILLNSSLSGTVPLRVLCIDETYLFTLEYTGSEKLLYNILILNRKVDRHKYQPYNRRLLIKHP